MRKLLLTGQVIDVIHGIAVVFDDQNALCLFRFLHRGLLVLLKSTQSPTLEVITFYLTLREVLGNKFVEYFSH
ncbi:Uncharacterised protein [Serratia fonticola]|nr:Uncharacterised protein [Serratia fonticola]